VVLPVMLDFGACDSMITISAWTPNSGEASHALWRQPAVSPTPKGESAGEAFFIWQIMAKLFSEYMRSRRRGKSGISKKEATLIGIPYPLAHGWLKKYAGLIITDQMLLQLKSVVSCMSEQEKEWKAKKKENKARARADMRSCFGEREKPELPPSQSPSACVTIKFDAPTTTNKREYDGFYESREWRELRYKALVSYGPICQCCGASRKNGSVIHVDHIKPRSKFPELQLVISNLQILCEECNLGKSNKDSTDWR